MNTCLNCGKEYSAQRQRSKYCSVKCRVAHYRKNPPKKGVVINPIDFQAMHRDIMGAVAKLGTLVDQERVQTINPAPAFEQPIAKRPAIKKPYATYQALINECESQDQYFQLRAEIEAAEHLSRKEKDILLRKR